MSKKLLVLLTLVLLIVPLASVNAQNLNEGIDYCEILQSDDCQILVNSAETMSTVSSAAFDMSMSYDIAIDDDSLGMDDMSFGIAGNGMIALDTALFNQLGDLMVSDPAIYMQQLPTLMDGVFAGIDGEAYLVITLPDMFGAMAGTTEIPLNLLMKDGVYAVDVASLEEAVGQPSSGMAWAGIDLNGAFESLMGDFDMSELYDEDTMNALTQPNMEALTEAISITRLADSEVNGQAVAVFETTFDYGAFLTSDEMMESINSMYNDMGMSPAEAEAALAMLNEIQVVINQYIGLDDSYNYRTEVSMDFAIDGQMMGDASMGSMGLGFDMAIDLSNFNAPVDIQIPEDAMIVPFEMLMGGGF